jgi:hypothetical protein
VLDEHTLCLEFMDDPWLVIARLSGGGGQVGCSVSGRSDVALTTEDPDVVNDAMRVVLTDVNGHVSERGRTLKVEFGRPGAVVIRGLRIATSD